MIHIGIDTVKLGGEYFAASLVQNQPIQQSDLLVSFDLDKLKELKYGLVTPIVITNKNDYKVIAWTSQNAVEISDYLYSTSKINQSGE